MPGNTVLACITLLLMLGSVSGEYKICSLDGFSEFGARQALGVSVFFENLMDAVTNMAQQTEIHEQQDARTRFITVSELEEINLSSDVINTTESMLVLKRDDPRLPSELLIPRISYSPNYTCIYEAYKEFDFVTTPEMFVASLYGNCGLPYSRLITDMCVQDEQLRENCPDPFDAWDSPYTHQTWPNPSCPSFCLDPQRFNNSMEQYFLDLMYVTRLSQPHVYRGHVLSKSVVCFISVYGYSDCLHSSFTGPNGGGYLQTIIELVGAYPIAHATPPSLSLAAPQNNPGRKALWTPPWIATTRGEPSSVVDLIVPSYVGDTYLGCSRLSLSFAEIQERIGVVDNEATFAFLVDERGSILTSSVHGYTRLMCPGPLCTGENNSTFNITQCMKTIAVSPAIRLSESPSGAAALVDDLALLRESNDSSMATEYDIQGEMYVFEVVRLSVETIFPWFYVLAKRRDYFRQAAVWEPHPRSIRIELEDGHESLDEHWHTEYVTLNNSGHLPVTWKAELPDDIQAYIVVSPPQGMIAADSSVVVVVNISSFIIDIPERLPEASVAFVPTLGPVQCFSTLFLPLSLMNPREASSQDATSILWAILVPAAVLVLVLFLYSVINAIWKARKEAEAANKRTQEEQDFVAFTFHELRNPLNGVMGHIEMAQDLINQHMLYTLNQRDKVSPLSTPEGELDEYKDRHDDEARRGSGSSSDGIPTNPSTLLGMIAGELSQSMECGIHAIDVLNNVLDMSSLIAGNLELKVEPLSVHDLLDSVARMHPGHDLELLVDVDPTIPTVVGDVLRMKQVLLNFTANALKYTTHGRVCIHARRVRADGKTCDAEREHFHNDATVSVSRPFSSLCQSAYDPDSRNNPCIEMYHSAPSVSRSAAAMLPHTSSRYSVYNADVALGEDEVEDQKGSIQIEFSVTDTGCGVPASMQKAIFTKYESLDCRVGTGLGLFVCERIVSLMGSHIELESPYLEKDPLLGTLKENIKNGPGSRFSFRVELPIANSSPLNRLSPSSRRQSKGESIFIIVDDHKSTDEDMVCERVCCPLPPAVDAPLPVRSTKRVLIVEDVKMNRKLLRRRLDKISSALDISWEVEVACTGEIALAKLCGMNPELEERDNGDSGSENDISPLSPSSPSSFSHYDLITMDENMSLAGGSLTGKQTVIEYHKQCAANGVSPSPIIFVTGNCSPADRDAYLKCGAVAVWGKPFPPVSEMTDDVAAILDV